MKYSSVVFSLVLVCFFCFDLFSGDGGTFVPWDRQSLKIEITGGEVKIYSSSNISSEPIDQIGKFALSDIHADYWISLINTYISAYSLSWDGADPLPSTQNNYRRCLQLKIIGTSTNTTSVTLKTHGYD